jgi:hypothetical protein
VFRNKNIGITFSIVKALVTRASFCVIVTNARRVFSKSVVEATFIKTCLNCT